jgi:4-hydroxy-tetrahydrodipicolinate synthase
VNTTVQGVLAAVLTPLNADLSPDRMLLARHCRWLLENGCSGLAVLGTTSEANSFSVEERLQLLDGLVEEGIPGNTLLPGTGCCAVPDTVRLTQKAIELGAAGVLMLPPFYYKNVSEEGVFAAYSEVIDQIGDPRLRVYLYHFPQMSGVGVSRTLIERLLKRYPDVIAGMKDSSGNLDNMIGNARTFPGFGVLSGSDEFLLPLLKEGGAGCITAVCNVAMSMAAEVYDAWARGDLGAAELAHGRLTLVRRAISAYPLTAALKDVMARHTGNDGWRRVRPPLTNLAPAECSDVLLALDLLGFAPPAVV